MNQNLPAAGERWSDDADAAIKNNTTVEALQRGRETAAQAREILPDALSEIDAAIEAAQAAHEAALDRKREVEAKVSQWDRLRDAKNRIAQELTNGESRLAAMSEAVDGRIEFIGANIGEADNVSNHPHRLTELAALAAGAKFFCETVFPKWIKAKKAELEKANTEIEAFAKANDIPLV